MAAAAPAVPFPTSSSEVPLMPTQLHSILSKTNPQIKSDYFSADSIPQVKSTGQSQERQWRRWDGTAGMLWGTQPLWLTMPYNGSSSHKTLPVSYNNKKLAETRVSKAWQPWVGHLTSHKHTWHWTKKDIIKTKQSNSNNTNAYLKWLSYSCQ